MRAAAAYSACVGTWMVLCFLCEGLCLQPQNRTGGGSRKVVTHLFLPCHPWAV